MAALPGRTPLVVGFLQMSQGDFGMFGRYLGLVRSAVLDRFLQMLDAGLRISIGLFFLSISGVLERGRGVFDERRSVSLIALIDGFLRVLDCLLEVTFGRERNLRRHKQSEAQAQHGDHKSTSYGWLLLRWI